MYDAPPPPSPADNLSSQRTTYQTSSLPGAVLGAWEWARCTAEAARAWELGHGGRFPSGRDARAPSKEA